MNYTETITYPPGCPSITVVQFGPLWIAHTLNGTLMGDIQTEKQRAIDSAKQKYNDLFSDEVSHVCTRDERGRIIQIAEIHSQCAGKMFPELNEERVSWPDEMDDLDLDSLKPSNIEPVGEAKFMQHGEIVVIVNDEERIARVVDGKLYFED